MRIVVNSAGARSAAIMRMAEAFQRWVDRHETGLELAFIVLVALAILAFVGYVVIDAAYNAKIIYGVLNY